MEHWRKTPKVAAFYYCFEKELLIYTTFWKGSSSPLSFIASSCNIIHQMTENHWFNCGSLFCLSKLMVGFICMWTRVFFFIVYWFHNAANGFSDNDTLWNHPPSVIKRPIGLLSQDFSCMSPFHHLSGGHTRYCFQPFPVWICHAVRQIFTVFTVGGFW